MSTALAEKRGNCVADNFAAARRAERHYAYLTFQLHLIPHQRAFLTNTPEPHSPYAH
jgi:hypothetical protein